MVAAINALQPHGFAAELVQAAVQDPLNVGLFLFCSHCIRGSDVAKSKQPGSIACSLSCSVLTKNLFLRWNITIANMITKPHQQHIQINLTTPNHLLPI
jgi:hypothetical protein